MHYLDLEWSRGWIKATARCTGEPDAKCHLVCDEGCEQWTTEYDYEGRPHHTVDTLSGEVIRHEMVNVSYCVIAEYFNNCDDLIECGDADTFRMAEVAIEPQWEGDYYSWRPAPQ